MTILTAVEEEELDFADAIATISRWMKKNQWNQRSYPRVNLYSWDCVSRLYTRDIEQVFSMLKEESHWTPFEIAEVQKLVDFLSPRNIGVILLKEL